MILLGAALLEFLIKIVDLAEGVLTHFLKFFLSNRDRICPEAEAISGCIFASACEQQKYHHCGDLPACFSIQLHH